MLLTPYLDKIATNKISDDNVNLARNAGDAIWSSGISNSSNTTKSSFKKGSNPLKESKDLLNVNNVRQKIVNSAPKVKKTTKLNVFKTNKLGSATDFLKKQEKTPKVTNITVPNVAIVKNNGVNSEAGNIKVFKGRQGNDLA